MKKRDKQLWERLLLRSILPPRGAGDRVAPSRLAERSPILVALEWLVYATLVVLCAVIVARALA